MKLGVAVNYCSNEERFLEPCLRQLLKLTDHIVVSVSDHFFDGSKEDVARVRTVAPTFAPARFLIYEAQNQYQPDPGIYSRKLAVEHMSPEVDWILFLDVDEIVDVGLWRQFVSRGEYEAYDSIKLANHYYFCQPIYRAVQVEDSAVLVRRDYAKFDPNLQQGDRSQVHEMIDCRKSRGVMVNGECIVHHFSWVRTKSEMLKKVTSWGHKHDRDWSCLVEEEFSHEFNGRCFVHGYQYDRVADRFGIGLI